MQKKNEQPANELYGEYGKVFNFTQGDLEANRAGFLSFRQKQAFRLRILLYLCTALLSLFIYMGGIFPWNTGGNLMLALAVTLIPFGFLTAILLPYVRNLLLDLQDGRIKAVKGEAKVIDKTIKGEAWGIRAIDDEAKYELRPWQIESVKAKGKFYVYVMPKTKQIVSIEEILAEQTASILRDE